VDDVPDSHPCADRDDGRCHDRLCVTSAGDSTSLVDAIERWNPPFEFVDTQTKGPYKLWQHTHRFSAVEGGTLIADTVEYALPFGVMGRLIHRMHVAQDLSRIFDYREQTVRELFA
jgi:ligand-binding SRPBCC domain-containing protein